VAEEGGGDHSWLVGGRYIGRETFIFAAAFFYMEVAFIFAGCPPSELLELKRLGYLIVSTADCQGVEKVDDVEAYVRGRFALVVGDAELAKRLDVGYMSWEEAFDFLKWAR